MYGIYEWKQTKEELKKLHPSYILFESVEKQFIEETGLANAITAGRKNDFVSEDEILDILKGKQNHHATQT